MGNMGILDLRIHELFWLKPLNESKVHISISIMEQYFTVFWVNVFTHDNSLSNKPKHQ